MQFACRFLLFILQKQSFILKQVRIIEVFLDGRTSQNAGLTNSITTTILVGIDSLFGVVGLDVKKLLEK
jgi:hypothetical protein